MARGTDEIDVDDMVVHIGALERAGEWTQKSRNPGAVDGGEETTD